MRSLLPRAVVFSAAALVAGAATASAAPAPTASARPAPTVSPRPAPNASARPATTVSSRPHRATPYEPGEVLVLPWGSAALDLDAAGGTGTSTHASRASRAAAELARYGLARDARAGAARTAGTRVLRLSSQSPGFDPVTAARELRATGAFRAAIPNYHVRLSLTIPNDPYVLPEQWYIQATNDADVDLPEAWDVEKGSPSVVIGIIDTGVDLGHPDLAGKIWTNPGEIPGNGIDDEGDGYIDDVNGWDFGDGDADPNPNPVFDEETGIDAGFHGTFVAGIAAASTNNGEGIAGAGWNCRVMPLKVANSAGILTTEAIAGAFEYAADHHIAVLNLSLGSPNDSGVPEFFQALVDLAVFEGVVVVSSAGNDASDALSYPAACAGAIAVGATDRGQLRASFSNWGSWVDIAAPGEEIWSTICRNYEIDEFSQIFYLYLWSWDGASPYMYGNGTSFACPLVAGTAALVRSRWTTLTPAEVEAHLKATGDNVAYDLPIGRKLNAFAAMGTPSALGVAPRPEPRGLSFAPAEPNPSNGRVRFGFAIPLAGDVSLTIRDTQGRLVRRVVDGRLGAGPHRAEWDGAAADERSLESGVYFATLSAAGQNLTLKVARVR